MPQRRRGHLSALMTAALVGPAGALVAVGSTALVPAPAQAAAWPGHPDRSILRHTVRAGETASGLAVRYHAWTAELVRLNHLGASGTLREGQVVRVPVVLSAARQHSATTSAPTAGPRKGAWRDREMSRAEVRRMVVRTAQHHGVPTDLALAVAWQESGWQQRRVSSAGALGVMQVMPDTGRWMRQYAGRPLRLRDTQDNVHAGVLTLKVLRASTRRDDNAIGAYYQGLGAVRRHGLYDDTVVYVRSVRAHERRISMTGSPL